jgi:hypothetical protein
MGKLRRLAFAAVLASLALSAAVWWFVTTFYPIAPGK